MIKGVKDFYYNVKDMKKAIKFYAEAFGMKPQGENEFWTSMVLNGVTVGLHWSEGKDIPLTQRNSHGQNHGGTLTLESDNIAEDRKRIEKCGGKILGESDEHWGHMLAFEDLDGNVLKLMNPKGQ